MINAVLIMRGPSVIFSFVSLGGLLETSGMYVNAGIYTEIMSLQKLSIGFQMISMKLLCVPYKLFLKATQLPSSNT